MIYTDCMYDVALLFPRPAAVSSGCGECHEIGYPTLQAPKRTPGFVRFKGQRTGRISVSLLIGIRFFFHCATPSLCKIKVSLKDSEYTSDVNKVSGWDQTSKKKIKSNSREDRSVHFLSEYKSLSANSLFHMEKWEKLSLTVGSWSWPRYSPLPLNYSFPWNKKMTCPQIQVGKRANHVL